MKRAFYEWGAITTTFLALACFAYWVISLPTPRADFDMFVPLGRWEAMQIKGSVGHIALSDRSDSLLTIETVTKYRVVNPPLSGRTHWSLPGFTYRSIRSASGVTWWLECSLLIPGVFLTLLAAFFFYGYARVRRQAWERFQQQRSTDAQRSESAGSSPRQIEARRA